MLAAATLFGSMLPETNQKTELAVETETGEIKGKITNKATGDPIAFANIAAEDALGNTVAGTTSDMVGNYSIKSIKAGTYNITASFVGYRKITIEKVSVTAGSTTRLNIKMEAENIQLDAVEVTEHKTPVAANEEALSTRIISYDKTRTKKDSKRSYNRTTIQSGYAPAHYGNITGGTYYNQNFNTESYDHIIENDFKEVKVNPLSTFSIDVDAASYANVRRFINQGQTPPKDAVRIEEMINYFGYDYPQPDGEHPFEIYTEIANCPWNTSNKLVHIGIQGQKIETENLPSSNIVFLIDVSGSMQSYNKLPLLKKSFRLLVNQMRQKDRVAIVVYAGAAGLVLESTPGSQKDKILAAIDRLRAGGSTAGGAGIKLAYKVALENFIKEGNNRIVLATDGDFNIGASSNGDMVTLIEEKRKSGVFLTVLGYGMGNYKDSKMEQISNAGNGNYAYIDNIMEAKKVLVNEMGGTMFTIAKDVKIQIEFNPEKVASYKLIGYENRLLNEEDFNDDTKDAGELGSGHTVTALYEIVPVGAEEEVRPKVDPLRYQQNNVSEEMAFGNELMTVKFRYKHPKEEVSKLIVHHLMDEDNTLENTSENFKFSAAVAEFGLLLRGSKFKGNSSYAQVAQLARAGKGKDENGYRSEFIRLVEMNELASK